MSVPRFQAGDKVVLAYADYAPSTTPKLVPERVYCVRKVTIGRRCRLFPPHQRLHLCGVRPHKCMRHPEHGLPWSAFRIVGDNARETA